MKVVFKMYSRINGKEFHQGDTLVVGEKHVESIEKLNDEYIMVIINGLRYDILIDWITII